MKRFLIVAMCAAMLLLSANAVFADNPVNKLSRGINDVVAAPFEIFKGIEDAAIEKGVFGGVTVGTLQGLANALTRAVKGVYEVTTFPIPSPDDFNPDKKKQ